MWKNSRQNKEISNIFDHDSSRDTNKFVLVLRLLSSECFGGVSFITVAKQHFFGMCIVPIIPICMSFSVEVTFPMQPSISNGIVFLFGQIGAFLLSMVGTKLQVSSFSTSLNNEEQKIAM